MPHLFQALEIMILHTLLSDVFLMKLVLLLLLFRLVHVFKLVTKVSFCRPLLLSPSILPVIARCSISHFLQVYSINRNCLYLMIFKRYRSMFSSFSVSTFVFFSMHGILSILLINHICVASIVFSGFLVKV